MNFRKNSSEDMEALKKDLSCDISENHISLHLRIAVLVFGIHELLHHCKDPPKPEGMGLSCSTTLYTSDQLSVGNSAVHLTSHPGLYWHYSGLAVCPVLG